MSHCVLGMLSLCKKAAGWVCCCHQQDVLGDLGAFLKQLAIEGMSRPPLDLEMKMRAGSADLFRPHHFFSSFVTGGSRVCSIQVSGLSAAMLDEGRHHCGISSALAGKRVGIGQLQLGTSLILIGAGA